MNYAGQCHCGAIGFSFATNRVPQSWPIRACTCSFCRAHGACCTSDPSGLVSFHLKKPDFLNRYTFALRTAEFLLCSNCGVYIAALLLSEEAAFATVNLKSLRAGIPELAAATEVSYATETRKQRIQRRRSNWTPVQQAAWI